MLRFVLLLAAFLALFIVSVLIARLRDDELAVAPLPASIVGISSLLLAAALLLFDAVPLWIQAATLIALFLLCLRIAFAPLFALATIPLLFLATLTPQGLALAGGSLLVVGTMATAVLVAAPKKSKL